MKIQVEYMGQLRQTAGAASEEIILDDDAACTIDQLLATLAARHGDELKSFLLTPEGAIRPSLLVVINGEQAPPNSTPTLKDNDTLTLMPPIAGG